MEAECGVSLMGFRFGPAQVVLLLGRVRNLQGGALLEEVVTWAGLCLPTVGLFPCVFLFSHLNLTLFLHLRCGVEDGFLWVSS